MHKVKCLFYKKELAGLVKAPYHGELGNKIYNNISEEAWKLWQKQQTMLINENKLSMIKKEDREFLEQKMQEFLFEGKTDKPDGYRPTES